MPFQNFLESLRIPPGDCAKYQNAFHEMGYDDFQSLQEDAGAEELEKCGVKVGHIRRILKALESMDTDNDLSNSSANTPCINPYPNLSLKIPRKKQSSFSEAGFKITGSGIEMIPDELLSTTTPLYPDIDSMAVPRYTKDATIVVRKVGRGASSTVFKALYIPTLTFVAIKCIDVVDTNRRKQMLTELGQLYSFSRHPLVISRSSQPLLMSDDDDRPPSGNSDAYLDRDARDKPSRLVLINVVLFCSLGVCVFLEILLIARDSWQSSIMEKNKEVVSETQRIEVGRFTEHWELVGRVVGLIVTLCISYIIYRRGRSIDYDAADEIDPDQITTDGESIICPFVVKFFDAYLDIEHEAICLVFEYMDGGSLQNIVDDGMTLNDDDVAIVAYSVLKALEMLHSRNIIHRDVKPANILLTSEGHIKLSDFGVAKDIGVQAAAETFTGTLHYMSPERVKSDKYSYSSDIWSVGITLLKLRADPFCVANDYWEFLRDIDSSDIARECTPKNSKICDFIRSCVQVNPAARLDASALLSHSFIKDAIERGVVTLDQQPKLQRPIRSSLLQKHQENPEMIVDKIMEWYALQLDEDNIESFSIGKMELGIHTPQSAPYVLHSNSVMKSPAPFGFQRKSRGDYLDSVFTTNPTESSAAAFVPKFKKRHMLRLAKTLDCDPKLLLSMYRGKCADMESEIEGIISKCLPQIKSSNTKSNADDVDKEWWILPPQTRQLVIRGAISELRKKFRVHASSAEKFAVLANGPNLDLSSKIGKDVTLSMFLGTVMATTPTVSFRKENRSPTDASPRDSMHFDNVSFSDECSKFGSNHDFIRWENIDEDAKEDSDDDTVEVLQQLDCEEESSNFNLTLNHLFLEIPDIQSPEQSDHRLKLRPFPNSVFMRLHDRSQKIVGSPLRRIKSTASLCDAVEQRTTASDEPDDVFIHSLKSLKSEDVTATSTCNLDHMCAFVEQTGYENLFDRNCETRVGKESSYQSDEFEEEYPEHSYF